MKDPFLFCLSDSSVLIIMTELIFKSCKCVEFDWPESRWWKAHYPLIITATFLSPVRKDTSRVNSHAAVSPPPLPPSHLLHLPVTSLHLWSRPLPQPRAPCGRGAPDSAGLAVRGGVEHAHGTLPETLQRSAGPAGVWHCREQAAALPGAGDWSQWAHGSIGVVFSLVQTYQRVFISRGASSFIETIILFCLDAFTELF